MCTSFKTFLCPHKYLFIKKTLSVHADYALVRASIDMCNMKCSTDKQPCVFPVFQLPQIEIYTTLQENCMPFNLCACNKIITLGHTTLYLSTKVQLSIDIKQPQFKEN